MLLTSASRGMPEPGPRGRVPARVGAARRPRRPCRGIGKCPPARMRTRGVARAGIVDPGRLARHAAGARNADAARASARGARAAEPGAHRTAVQHSRGGAAGVRRRAGRAWSGRNRSSATRTSPCSWTTGTARSRRSSRLLAVWRRLRGFARKGIASARPGAHALAGR